MLKCCALAVILATLLPAQSATEDAWRALNAGIALLEQYTPEKAALRFEEALKLDATLNAARINLAIALHHQSKPVETLKVAEEAVRKDPTSPHAHFLVGLAARQTGDVEKANAAFAAVLARDPLDTASAIHLARLLIEKNQPDKAVALLRPAVEREPFNTTALYSLATTLQRMGQRDEAKPLLQKFQGLRNSGYATSLGTQYLEAGRYAHAVAAGASTQSFHDHAEPLRFEGHAESVPEFLPTRLAAATAFVSKPNEEVLKRWPGSLCLADLDGDGDSDALTGGAAGLVQWRNDAGKFVQLRCLMPGLCTGVLAADMTGDGKPDAAALTTEGIRIFLLETEPVERIELSTTPALPMSLTALDIDHDGDLDLLAGTLGASHFFRQLEPRRFEDQTSTLGTTLPEGVHLSAASDIDLGRDVDLVLGTTQQGLQIFRNLRDGSFRDVSAACGLSAFQGLTSFTLADFNKDGCEDLVASSAQGTSLFGSSNGRFGATALTFPAGMAAMLAADLDADGWLDLAGLRQGAIVALRGTPRGFASFAELKAIGGPTPHDALAAADVDLDGDMDLVTLDLSGAPAIQQNQMHGARSVHVALTGRASNRSGLGTRVDVRAGSLAQKLELGASAPATRAATPMVGLGERASADAIRLLWPSGNVQAEIPLAGAKPGAPWNIEEVDRKPSSCPNVYAWDGTQHRFLTDFLGGGEMGSWVADGVRNTPDPVEYLRIPAHALAPREGAFDIRITNELEEALYLDHVSLMAVDHPAGVEVHPNEGLTFTSPRPWRLHASRCARLPDRAVDATGSDQREALARADGRAADGFTRKSIRGFAEQHQLTLEWNRAPAHPVLLLTGWTEYAWSSDTRRAEQQGLLFDIPRLERRNADGSWTLLTEDLGIPVGHPQTMAVALDGIPADEPLTLRISTNMRVCYDTIQLAEGAPTTELHLARQLPTVATLRWRGYSARVTQPGSALEDFDYSRTSAAHPWKTFAGHYTRCGDVRALVSGVDDLLLVATSGDELQLTFPEQGFPSLRPGWQRTFLLHAHGWSKEMDPNSATPDAHLPLPFTAMKHYPYAPGEARPATEFWHALMDATRTRVIQGRVPFTPVAEGR